MTDRNYPALTKWLLQHAPSHKFIQPSELRPDNEPLRSALAELRSLVLFASDEDISGFVACLRVSLKTAQVDSQFEQPDSSNVHCTD